MAYIDRLRDMIYTSPSGKTFNLLYDQVSETGGKKGPDTELPLQDQAAVQDLGNLTKRYPVTCYIAGANYDTEADRFVQALDETGAGTLEHPRYGTLTVLPRSVSRSESFVDGAGRAMFDIDFVLAEEIEYPRVTQVVDDLIASDIADAITSITATLDGKTVTNARELAAISDETTDLMAEIETSARDTLADSIDAASEMQAKTDAVVRDIDTLKADPQALFERIMEIIQIPIDISQDALTKAKSIKQTVERISVRMARLGQAYGDIVRLFSMATLQGVLAWVSGLTINALFNTRGNAGRTIDTMGATRDVINDAIVDVEGAGTPADATSQIAAENAFTRSITNVIDRQLTLPTERIITLDREVPPTVLAWELYGDLSQLDTLITYNDLRGDSLIMIPRDTEVRYYV